MSRSEELELRPIRHKVIERGYSVLLIEQAEAKSKAVDGAATNWIIPSAYICVAFHSNPRSVLRYGSNSLHFAEHVLWNMTARDVLHRSNAATFGSGEMAVYGMCLERELASAMTYFFDGLIAATQCRLSPTMRERIEIEQRRVTCETSHMSERSVLAVSEKWRMFVYNTDIARSEYPIDYVWKVLLEECRLGRVVVMAHCRVSAEDVLLFERLADNFQRAWDGRAAAYAKHSVASKAKPLPLPTYYAPPFSMLGSTIVHRSSRSSRGSSAADMQRSKRSKRSKPRTIAITPWQECCNRATDTVVHLFEDDVNPIERLIIQSVLQLEASPYIFSIELTPESIELLRSVVSQQRLPKRHLRYSYSPYCQYFAVPLLAAYSGGVDSAWIDDLYNLSPDQIEDKYSKPALARLSQILASLDDC